MKTQILNVVCILTMAATMLVLAPVRSAHASGLLTVNTLTDENDGSCVDGDCSLRDALAIANNGDTINFSVTGTIPLSLGQLVINDSLTITGPGAEALTIDGNFASRIFNIADNETVIFSGLTLTHGFVIDGNGGAILTSTGDNVTLNNMVLTQNQVQKLNIDFIGGGAIYNFGTIIINNSTISNNTAWQYGGGIWSANNSSLVLSNTILVNNKAQGYSYTYGGAIALGNNTSALLSQVTITNNKANFQGGGIYVQDNSNVNLQNSSLDGNNVTGSSLGSYGGGISAKNSVFSITDTTLNNNSATSQGGGIYSDYPNLTIVNSTLSNNKATSLSGDGGGIYTIDAGMTTITNSTITKNSATQTGGGIYIEFSGLLLSNTTVVENSGQYTGGVHLYVSTATIKNSLIADNIVSPDSTPDLCSDDDSIIFQGHNLIEDISNCSITLSSGDITGVDPKLNPLADNGGPTQTQSLQAGSPATDAGDNATCESTDQRGVTRPIDGNGDGTAICDIGAFEKQAPTFADVPDAYWAAAWIETLYHSGITGGCGTNPLIYCPDNQVTRAQMAVFLEKSLNGSGFSPANVLPSFNDTAGHWAEDWIEALKADAITSGCGNNNYCPESPVTRAQMAVFLLKAEHGSSYTPPTASGSLFGDVSSAYWAADWVEQLSSEGITSGCGNNNYCPDNPVTRAQMAVFLVKTFKLH